jgi:hypothetical protein
MEMETSDKIRRPRIRLIVKPIIFCCVLLFILSQISDVLIYKDHDFVSPDMMYEQPGNSIDVLFIGNSVYARAVAPDIIWKNSGISSYNRSSGSLSSRLTYLYLVDALRQQQPEVVILYTPRLIDGKKHSVYMEHRNMDPLKLSVDKFVIAVDAAKQPNGGNVIDYIIPVFFNHNMVKDILTLSKRTSNKDDFARGQSPKWQVRSEEDKDFILRGRIDPASEPQFAYNAEATAYYKKTIELCLSKGITPILMSPPTLDWDNEQYHATRELAEMYGIDYIDMNTDEMLAALDIDQKKDFYDHRMPKHMNGLGAVKVSEYLAEYLEKNFDLPDTREGNTAMARQWEKDIRKYDAYLQELAG